MTVEFTLPPALEAHEPPEARGRTRDGVRLLVSRRASGEAGHHEFRELPSLLEPGDLLVVNTSSTLPAAVRLDRISVHFSTPVPGGDGRLWIVELRCLTGKSSKPYSGGCPGEWIPMPGGATLTLIGRHTGVPGGFEGSSHREESDRLWQARLSTDVVPYLRRHGIPIRYGYVRREWPIAAYQTAFAHDRTTGSAEMPSAGRPFTPELVTRLVSRGVHIAPITLHTGVASPEAHEPPYAERYAVPGPTAALVEHVRAGGGRVIAVGTTAVRALETSVDASGRVRASEGWTEHIVTPERGVRAVDGILTGLHEPKSSHLMMLTAIAGPDLLATTYEAALAERYRWHEFGDANLVLPD